MPNESLGSRYRRWALLGAVCIFSVAPSGAAFQDEEPEQVTKTGKDDDPSPPAPSVTEFVFVEGSLPYVPESNTIGTKLPVELRFTPAHIGVVTRPLMEEQFDRVLGDALVNVSNVNVQSGFGVFDFFLIRGFDSLTSGLVLTDGASEPESSFYQLYNVELVEVLKGPGGFLYGSNPLAGAVNLVRKQPLPASFFDLTANAGSYDNYEGSVDWNYGTADGQAAFRLNSLWRDQGSHRDGKGGRTVAVNPSVSLELGEASSLNLNFEYADFDFVPDSGIPILGDVVADVPREANYQPGLDTSQQQIFRFQADFESSITDWLTLRNKFYRRDLDWLSNGTIFNGVFPNAQGSLVVNRTIILLDDRQDFTGNQFEAIFSFTTGSIGHDLLTGLELARFGDVFTLDPAVLPDIDLFDPVETAGPVPFVIPGASSAGDSRSIVTAPYFIDQIRFSEKLHATVGGRLDAIDFQDEVSGTARDDRKFSPMVGLVVSPVEGLSLFGNVSQSFAPPSNRVQGERVPEQSTQYELGLKKHFAPWNGQTTFAVYHLERENIAIPDDNGFTQQLGNQRSRGFEIELAAQPQPSLRTFVVYAFNDATLTHFSEQVLASLFPVSFITLDRSGNRPAFAPRHLLNFWVSKDLSYNWGVGGGGRYLSSQFIAEDNGVSLDSVLTFDATVFYRMGNLRLRLNLRNLTDQEYFTRGFGGTSVIPAPPFSAYFGIDLRM